MTLEELRVIISAETKGLERAVQGAKRTLNGLTKTVSNTTAKITKHFDRLGNSINKSFSSLLKGAGIAIGIASLVKLGKQAIKTASDLEEIQNVVDVTFGARAGQIDAWAKSALTSFGLVESEAKDLASTFKAMSNGLGIADDAGTAMSVKLAELSADLASFRNTTTEVARTALSGVFTGETEALKKFGVVMTQANLQAYALSRGITKSYAAMSQSEKVMLRYQYVLQATADAQGDFVRSSSSWANQMRILQGQWSSFLGVLGTGLKQVLAPLLQALNNILATVITLTKNILALFGVDFSTTAASVSSSFADAGAGVEDIADGLDDATGAAKTLKKELASFDELDIIGDKSDSGSGSGSGGGGLGGLGDLGSDLQIELPEVNTEEGSSPLFTSFKEALEKLEDWFENKLDPMLVKAGETFAARVNEFFGDSEVWNQAGETIGAGLNAIIHALDTFWTDVNGLTIGTSLAEMMNGWLGKWDAAATGHMLSEKMKTMLDVANAFLRTYDFKGLGEKIAEMFDNVDWYGLGERVGQLLSNLLLAAMDFAIGLTTGNWGQYISDFIDGFAAGWNGDELKQKFLEEFMPAMQEAWSELWASLEQNSVVGDLITTLEELIGTLKTLIEILVPLIALIKGLEIIASIFAFLTTGLPILTAIGDKLFDLGVFVESLGVASNGLVSPLEFLKGVFYQLQVEIIALNETYPGLISIIGEAAAIIGVLIASVIEAYKENENFRASVENLWNNTIKPFIDEIKDLLKDLWQNSLKPFFDEVGGLINDLIELIKSILVAIGTVTGKILEELVVFFGPQIETFIQFIHVLLSGLIQGLTGMVEVCRGIVQDFIKIFDGITEFLNGVFTHDWDRAWNGIKQIFEGVFKAFVDIAKAPINLIIGFINGMIKGITTGMNAVIRNINKVSWDVPSWVPGIGGQKFGFNVPEWQANEIAYLAKGGVLDKPTLAMLGEYSGASHDPEIATPQSLMRETIVNANGEMVQAFYQMATQIIQAIEQVDMEVSIGDDVIAQAAKRGSDDYRRRTGRPMYATA